jgi:hypothetical protein
VASIQSITFDQPSYTEGEQITLTVEYTPDTAGTAPVTFTATVLITDASGAQTATASAPFVVAVPSPGGDVVSATDTGNRTWAQVSDSGTVAVFTTVA